MQSKFEAAINQICEEKNLDKQVVIAAIESAIGAAYRKEYGTDFQKIDVVFDIKVGTAKIFNVLDVVKSVEYPDSQISLSEAKKIQKDVKDGGRLRIDVTPKGEEGLHYGRIAAQTAKQVIIQRLQEAERDAIYEKYKDRVQELIPAQVQRVESSGVVFLNMEGTTVLLYPNEQIPREKYFTGQRVKVYISKVERTSKGPSIVVSRADSQLIQKLLEMEVPEISEGVVVVKGLAREPGIRTKIAVSSIQEGIDPVGSCVGQRGVRIQAITNEIGEEKIDIIEYTDDIIQMIINALAPAKITSIELSPNKKRAKVYVLEDQRSLAIGKNGQNVRLASKLLNIEIDILDFDGQETVSEKVDLEQQSDLGELSSVSTKIAHSLIDAGIVSVKDILEKTVEDLSALPGIGAKTAEKILQEAQSK